MDYYSQIFRRKSFHRFTDVRPLTDNELSELDSYIQTIRPLDQSIRTRFVIERSTKADAPHCVSFYSEKKDGYLRNIGYMGQQLDLYCTRMGIASLWYGLGKPIEKTVDGLDYVIKMAIGKTDGGFRDGFDGVNRKDLSEIWEGETLGVADVVRFAPSACNSQPWFVRTDGKELCVYRRRPSRISIMTPAIARYFNRIDIGIFLFILETCLEHEGYSFTVGFENESLEFDDRYTPVCRYILDK